MRKHILILIILILTLSSLNALDFSKANLDKQQYKEAFIKIHLKRAYIYKSFANFPKAYEMYAELVEFDKARKDYYIFLINGLKRYQARYELFKGFDSLIVPTESARFKTLMVMAKQKKDVIQRIKLYKAALREKKGDVSAIIGIAKAYIKLNKHFTAKKWLNKVKDSEEASILIKKIDYILDKSDKYMMKVQVNESVKSSVEKKKLDLLNGFIDKKEFNKAVNYLNSLILEEPGNYNLFFKLADVYSREAMYDSAVDQLDRAIILNPNFYQAYYMKGEIFTKTGKISQAKDVYVKLIEIAPIDSKFNRLAKNMLNSLSSQ